METPATITNTNHRESTIRKHYPEFYKYLHETYPNIPWMEKCYLYYNNLMQPPKCSCGNPVKFLSLFRGYSAHCSPACAASDPAVLDKFKTTCQQKFGTASPLHKNSSTRAKVEKSIISKYGGMGNASDVIKSKIAATNLERYGVEMPMQSIEIQHKIKKSVISKYGGMGNASDAIKSKVAATNLERYGVENFACSESYKQLYDAKQKLNHPDILSIEGDTYICACPHPGCNKCDGRYVVPKSIYIHRKCTTTEPCTILVPVGPQNANTGIEVFVQKLLDKHNIKYTTSDRSIIPPKSVDICIPSHKIVIECNGIYWHSDRFKSKTAHINRAKVIENAGYQLITIWEDWIKNNPGAVEDIILSKLGIHNVRIYARKCKIASIPNNTYKEFLNCHIQGPCTNPIRYGLYYGDELVAVMGFCKKRQAMMGNKTADDSYELARFCTKPGHQIIGGAGKLLSRFINDYNPSKIISFSSNDISDGNMYAKLGFTKAGTNKSYWYIDAQMVRHHRYKYRKSKLISLGYDKTKTEFEITDSMGLYRIWDTGQTKWEMII